MNQEWTRIGLGLALDNSITFFFYWSIWLCYAVIQKKDSVPCLGFFSRRVASCSASVMMKASSSLSALPFPLLIFTGSLHDSLLTTDSITLTYLSEIKQAIIVYL